jgi:pseudouridine-5'-phosphate glycosidase
MRIRCSEEVRQALAAKGPLVALETSVVAQGMPYPENLAVARACEEAVRRAGAVPAPVAVLDGELWVGAPTEGIRRLAEPGQAHWKVGSRDLAMAVARKASGGTTVSATCELAAKVGVRVFATGGIGGVHRGVAEHLDVSQDLGAISRFPVAVVCAGAKSVLDLPKTVELLESLGVPVIGVGTSELPSFFSVRSGIALEHRVDTAQEAATVLQARLDALGQGGLVFAVPPPPTSALPAAQVEAVIREALAQADAQGVSGKAVTPFLLGRLAEVTQGRTLKANVDLIVNNARFAAELAVADAASR